MESSSCSQCFLTVSLQFCHGLLTIPSGNHGIIDHGKQDCFHLTEYGTAKGRSFNLSRAPLDIQWFETEATGSINITINNGVEVGRAVARFIVYRIRSSRIFPPAGKAQSHFSSLRDQSSHDLATLGKAKLD